MPLDYGQRTGARMPRGLWLGGLAVGLAVVGAVAESSAIYHRRLEAEQGWVNGAPACPPIPRSAYSARGYAARERATPYDGVTFARQFGHMMCADVDTRGWWGLVSHPACQFTSANAIRVKAGGTEAFFEPGPGRLATVSVERGRVFCELAGKFTLFHDPTN